MAKVYGVSASPFVRKVRVFLEEKGVDYEVDPVFPGSDDESYRRISPTGKIPSFAEGDLKVPDSSVICAYLERTRPEPRLYPSQPADFARALWLEEYADTVLVGPATVPFFEKVLAPRLYQRETNEEALAKAVEKDLPPLCDYLQEQLGEASYLVGGTFSIADISVATQFVNLSYGADIDGSRWPRLAAYLEGLFTRPSFKKLIAEDRKLFADIA